jgi:DnaJ homolog subfamily C member 28
VNRLESMAEKRLREAIENGEFDNLPGKGGPVDLRENPFEDPDLRVVHRLLRNAGFAPAWIEERKEIDASFATAQTQLTRAWALFREGSKTPSPAEWARSLQEFRQLVAELNQRIRIYNLKAPSDVFHRKHIDVERVVAAIIEDAK